LANQTIIESVHAMEILDSRGNPTIETEITLTNGAEGAASVPSLHPQVHLKDDENALETRVEAIEKALGSAIEFI